MQILKFCIQSLMYQSLEQDLLAALCFDQSNGGEDPYAFIQINQENLFAEFGSSGMNLQPEQEQVCNNTGSTQLDLGASCSGVLQQEPHRVCNFRGRNNDSRPHVEKEHEQMCCGVVEINSSSSVGGVKEGLEHVEEEGSRER